MGEPKSPEDEFDLDPANFAAFQRMVAAARARDAMLTELEKVAVVRAEAEAKLKQAQAREALHRAAAEPDRQRMALKERETRRKIGIGLALFAPAFLTAVLLLAPEVIPWAGIAAAAAYLGRGGGA